MTDKLALFGGSPAIRFKFNRYNSSFFLWTLDDCKTYIDIIDKKKDEADDLIAELTGEIADLTQVTVSKNCPMTLFHFSLFPCYCVTYLHL